MKFAGGLRIWIACAMITVPPGGCAPDPHGPGSYHDFVQKQKSAEETLAAQGATLEKKQYPPGQAWVIDLSGKQVNDETFAAFEALDHIAELDLSGTNVTDAHMQRLGKPEIGGVFVRLNLSNTDVGDQGLAALSDSLFLSELNLSGTNVTDAGVAQWQKARESDRRVRPQFKKVKLIR